MSKYKEILFGGKKPAEVLHDAFHEFARQKGHAGKPIHMWSAEGKRDAVMGDLDAAAPAHMQFAYYQNPRRMGYREARYGEISTQSGPWEGKKTLKTILRKSDKIPGGLAADKKDFSVAEKFAILRGAKMESKEHGPGVGAEISSDHVAEHGAEYYSQKGLVGMEKKLEKSEAVERFDLEKHGHLDQRALACHARNHSMAALVARAKGNHAKANFHLDQNKKFFAHAASKRPDPAKPYPVKKSEPEKLEKPGGGMGALMGGINSTPLFGGGSAAPPPPPPPPAPSSDTSLAGTITGALTRRFGKSLDMMKKAKGAKFERCVTAVKGQNKEKGGSETSPANPWAVCHASLKKEDEK
jgi:hypothetical protein